MYFWMQEAILMERDRGGRVNGKATMQDVARVAGVSPATAARVIHKNGYVSEGNRERVLKAVEETGYRPNIQARSLRMQRSYTLGLVLSSARDNPFFTNQSHAVRTAAMDSGYSMLTVNHGYSSEVEEAGVKQFLEHNVEAVILCHGWRTESYGPIIEAGVPIIQIESRSIASAHLVAIDPFPGMLKAVTTLVLAGHRRIAFVGGAGTGRDVEEMRGGEPEAERMRAFRRALLASGLAEEECPVVLGSYTSLSKDGKMPGYDLTMSLFRDREEAVTAIIAGSDVMAAGALQALRVLCLLVPEDISIIGYDDSLAQFLAPPIASIAQPYSEIGRATMEILEQVRMTDAIAPQTLEVQTQLTTRGSIIAPKHEQPTTGSEARA